ncbi:hypothetical protein ACH5RR_000725 [Cinchona calisaya]|uniref:Thaumatin-like protein n=1 Tax=Cinchona calisaya TaxID=153742 RepID=A0ABD3B1H5_9GENT
MEFSSRVRHEELLCFLQRILESASNMKTIDLGLELVKLTNNITCRMLMYIRCYEKDDEAEKCRKLVQETFDLAVKMSIREVLGPSNGVHDAAVFKLINRCQVSVWPGILAGAGKPVIDNSGIMLTPNWTATLYPPPGWSGRIWARTGCLFDEFGKGKCNTGDCNGNLQCTVSGVPPTSLAEFTLDSPQDFYDLSLVDGFNVPISIIPISNSSNCARVECVSNVNDNCPAELQVRLSNGRVVACKSACLAFGKPEYCCTEGYNSPQTCKPSSYSQVFKNACPKAYSYAFDDPIHNSDVERRILNVHGTMELYPNDVEYVAGLSSYGTDIEIEKYWEMANLEPEK